VNFFLKVYGEVIFNVFLSLIKRSYKTEEKKFNELTSFSEIKHKRMEKYAELAQRIFDFLVYPVGKKRYDFVKEVNFESCKLLIRPFLLSEIIMISGFREPYVKNILNVKKGDIFVDVGAHIGTYTIPIAKKVGEGGAVIAFEPHPKSRDLLEKNIAINQINNVVLMKQPVSDSRKKVSFRLSKDPPTSGIETNATNESNVEMESIDLDTALSEQNLTKIDWLKIDVEGNEVAVLKGSKNILKKFSPKIIIEMFNNETLEEGIKILESEGYELKKLYGMYYFAFKKKYN